MQPRLGPKPFSSDPSEFSFDQVFSVPQFPSTEDFEETDNKKITTNEENVLESFGNIILHKILKKNKLLYLGPDEMDDSIKKEEFKVPASFSDRKKVRPKN